jgi:hypothetical protein
MPHHHPHPPAGHKLKFGRCPEKGDTESLAIKTTAAAWGAEKLLPTPDALRRAAGQAAPAARAQQSIMLLRWNARMQASQEAMADWVMDEQRGARERDDGCCRVQDDECEAARQPGRCERAASIILALTSQRRARLAAASARRATPVRPIQHRRGADTRHVSAEAQGAQACPGHNYTRTALSHLRP